MPARVRDPRAHRGRRRDEDRGRPDQPGQPGQALPEGERRDAAPVRPEAGQGADGADEPGERARRRSRLEGDLLGRGDGPRHREAEADPRDGPAQAARRERRLPAHLQLGVAGRIRLAALLQHRRPVLRCRLPPDQRDHRHELRRRQRLRVLQLLAADRLRRRLLEPPAPVRLRQADGRRADARHAGRHGRAADVAGGREGRRVGADPARHRPRLHPRADAQPRLRARAVRPRVPEVAHERAVPRRPGRLLRAERRRQGDAVGTPSPARCASGTIADLADVALEGRYDVEGSRMRDGLPAVPGHPCAITRRSGWRPCARFPAATMRRIARGARRGGVHRRDDRARRGRSIRSVPRRSTTTAAPSPTRTAARTRWR